MNTTSHLAKHFHEVHFGKNYTWSNLKDVLEGLTWEQATTKVHSLNTIAMLVYHMNYYAVAVMDVLEGKSLTAKHEKSLECPPITSEADWKKLLDNTWSDAERFARLIEELPEEKLWEDFANGKYGNYFRNIQGNIEHIHYHLGQIAIIKKLVLEQGGKL